jgi:hypothetical protein
VRLKKLKGEFYKNMYWLLILLFIVVLIILIQQILNKAIIGQKKKYSIGIYEGDNIFDLKPLKNNPVLTKFDVNDVRASFVADPFVIKENDLYYFFFEVKSKRKRDIGEIGLAISEDLKHFEYQKIVIKENFNLSYPFVFKFKNEFFIILESGENRDLRLYKANNFPFEWKLERVVFENRRFADPTLLFLDNKIYLFVTNMENDSLEIYISTDLKNFTPHKKNSFYKGDKSKNRNGGRIFIDDDKTIYRFVQNCSNYYGEKVDMYKITKIDEDDFEEEFVKTILSPTKSGWNANQMHQIDIIKENNKYKAVVDGGSFEKENYYEINKFLRKFL